jgi:rhodanese-related sulfurtransferase
MVISRILTVTLCVLLGPALPAGAALSPGAAKEQNAEFPHRAKFPDVAILSTADLAKRLEQVVVVDVRTRFEFETLRIKGAINVPLSDRKFDDRVRGLADGGKKALVFYCNGRTCAKSYEAARKAIRSAKVENVFAYDPGIFEWARVKPEVTELLGRGPIKPENLIEEARFKERLLNAKDFAARVGAQSIVVDVRDLSQRDIALFPFKEKRVTLDQKAELEAVIDQAAKEGKTLLVYDKVGHQVQWLQYHLEAKGLKDYYFMKGGEEGYYKATLGTSTLDSLKR